MVYARPGHARPTTGGCAVSVGNFDGVHLGHVALARRLRAVADELHVPAVAMTFDPHPACIVRPAAAPTPLTTMARRIDLLLSLGLDAVVVQPAVPSLLGLDAEAFYRRVLRDRLGAAAIVEGPDFRFGAGRAGDIDELARLSRSDGVRLEVVAPVVRGGEAVSSSRLRHLIAAGAVTEARHLLTGPYRLTGRVVTGARRGATLGFPTANLDQIVTVLPAPGVYAARATVAGGHGGPVSHPTAVHVGPNATFGETAISVEAHLIGFAGDLYGETLHVDFLGRLRDTRRFDSVETLRSQLASDVAEAAEVCVQAGGADVASVAPCSVPGVVFPAPPPAD